MEQQENSVLIIISKLRNIAEDINNSWQLGSEALDKMEENIDEVKSELAFLLLAEAVKG